MNTSPLHLFEEITPSMFILIQELDRQKLRNIFTVNKSQIQLTLTDNYILLSDSISFRDPRTSANSPSTSSFKSSTTPHRYTTSYLAGRQPWNTLCHQVLKRRLPIITNFLITQPASCRSLVPLTIKKDKPKKLSQAVQGQEEDWKRSIRHSLPG